MPIESSNFSLASSLAPIETVAISPAVDGRNGTNRATGNHPQIAAQNDIDTIKAWLARFVDTKTTFDNYRRKPSGSCYGPPCNCRNHFRH